MQAYARIFGIGPLGAAVSVLLLGLAWLGADQAPDYAFDWPEASRWMVLAAGLAGGVGLIIWSIRSLPVGERGRRLCREGAFRWLRHPLYGAFLSLINPALAVFLDHPFYLVWAASLHPLWHSMIGYEEALMWRRFGAEYREYAASTGRFIPKFNIIKH